MELDAIRTSYARWAPVYDRTFGAITRGGRRRAVEYVNSRGGRVLEVGVGTGLSLRHYGPGVEVTGIDFSEDMLAKARQKVAEDGLERVRELRQMDARTLDFPEDHFDVVVAMHILSVVPEPERVMAEMARVCRPGGVIVVTNHFARDKGLLSVAERVSAPFSSLLGWHSDFPMERVTQDDRLRVVQMRSLPPLGMMTFLLLEKSLSN